MSKGTYTNPVMPGFHPDPSVVRVGEDYYAVNSTFQFFPAIVISHSRDLVNWRYIGHGITRSEWIPLADLPDSFGIWAPDISYHEGTYYIFATLRLHGMGRQNIMVKSDLPEGPYSKPVVLNTTGLDPSHFIDDDGAHYMVYGGGGAWIQRLSDDCTQAAGEPQLLWPGTGRHSPEGPHLLKKDGYYYVILAEGGTEYGHCITVARSRELFGEYEPCPFNPVHEQTDRNAVIQRAGHGKLVKTQHGEWWITHLGGRPLAGGFCTLGRETFLEPVEWTADGWLTVNGGRGPSDTQRLPQLETKRYDKPQFDDFDEGDLPLHWQFARNPADGDWSLTERPGHLRIWTRDAGLESIDSRNVLVRRETSHRYSASMKLEFAPARQGEEAGLVCYYDTRCFIKLALAYDGGLVISLTEHRARTMTRLAETAYVPGDPSYLGDLGESADPSGQVEPAGDRGVQSGQTSGSGGIAVDTATPIYFKVEVDGVRRTFYYSSDNAKWHKAGEIADAAFLSDEGTMEKKAFTGTLVGVFATGGGSGRRIAADVDWFRYEDR